MIDIVRARGGCAMRFGNVVGALLVAGSLLAVPVTGFAEVKVPVTAADHLALAKSYQQRAAEYRKVVAEHKEMADAYKKSLPSTPKIAGENPWAKKMEEHCRTLAADAEKLAADAEKAADYHTLRAKELQGK
jgi:hypothetical protein